LKTKDMILVAMFAVLTAVGAFISIPIPPVPVTLQFLMCILSGAVLGAKKGAMSQILYVFMGLVGLPIFAGGKGGIGHVMSPTFGYLIGFVVCAFIVGKAVESSKSFSIARAFGGALIGLALTYVIGASYLYAILNYVLESPIDIMGAVKVGVLPFALKDAIIAGIGSVVAGVLIPRLKENGLIGEKL
jgi:biotin transport system substrate-specific component